MTKETKRRNLLLASLRNLQRSLEQVKRGHQKKGDESIVPVFVEDIAEILRDGASGNDTITFDDAAELIDELCDEINHA